MGWATTWVPTPPIRARIATVGAFRSGLTGTTSTSSFWPPTSPAIRRRTPSISSTYSGSCTSSRREVARCRSRPPGPPRFAPRSRAALACTLFASGMFGVSCDLEWSALAGAGAPQVGEDEDERESFARSALGRKEGLGLVVSGEQIRLEVRVLDQAKGGRDHRGHAVALDDGD